jgi:hypothetical protein
MLSRSVEPTGLADRDARPIRKRRALPGQARVRAGPPGRWGIRSTTLWMKCQVGILRFGTIPTGESIEGEIRKRLSPGWSETPSWNGCRVAIDTRHSDRWHSKSAEKQMTYHAHHGNTHTP